MRSGCEGLGAEGADAAAEELGEGSGGWNDCGGW